MLAQLLSSRAPAAAGPLSLLRSLAQRTITSSSSQQHAEPQLAAPPIHEQALVAPGPRFLRELGIVRTDWT